MYTHLNFVFKQAFQFCTLAIKLFNSATKLFKAANATTTLNQSTFKIFCHP